MLFNKEEELIVIVGEFLRGELEAFKKLVKLTASDLVNIAFCYTGNLEDSQDISQNILIKLHRSLRSFRHNSKISTWIYRVAVNTCIDFLRKKKKMVPLEEELVRVEEEKGIVKHIERKDLEQRIQESLEGLPRRQKNAFVLKHFERLKISEISKILGCSESSTKTHLVRAAKNIRKDLGGIV